ncbi:Band 3 anion transport protein [Schistosoma japonicum]|nr:Band 3 anion transport protein [Schistosoma japonicum]
MGCILTCKNNLPFESRLQDKTVTYITNTLIIRVVARLQLYLRVVEEEHSGGSDFREGCKLSFHTGSYPTQMFIELQELVPRVEGGLQFDESIFKMPVAAHFRVLWLETARWVNFEENFNEVEQRFTEAHVPPMKFSCINSFREKLSQRKKLSVK